MTYLLIVLYIFRCDHMQNYFIHYYILLVISTVTPFCHCSASFCSVYTHSNERANVSENKCKFYPIQTNSKYFTISINLYCVRRVELQLFALSGPGVNVCVSAYFHAQRSWICQVRCHIPWVVSWFCCIKMQPQHFDFLSDAIQFNRCI